MSGQTSTELLVIGGVTAAILIVALLSFRTQVGSAVSTLGRCVGAAAGGSMAGCGDGGPAAPSTGGGKPAPSLPSVFGPSDTPNGGRGGPANGPPSGPLTGSVTGGLPGSPPRATPRVPTGLPGTMDGPLVTLPAPGTVKPGSGAGLGTSLNAWGELLGDGINTGGIRLVNGGDGPPTSLVAPEYGNWYGAGWSGGSRDPNRIGPLPPTDWLDAVGQKHDFGYAIAEEMGKLYGSAEEYRLKALADEIAARDAASLPDDPRDWVPPPADIEEARRNRDRLMVGFSQAHNRWLKLESEAASHLPLNDTGVMGPKLFENEEKKRVDAWNQDFLNRQANRFNRQQP